MGIPVDGIAVGKCFVTEIGQVRRVLEVKDGRVKYESRGKNGAWRIVGRHNHRGGWKIRP